MNRPASRKRPAINTTAPRPEAAPTTFHAPMPSATLSTLAAQLRDEDSIVSPYASDSDAPAALGELVASGPAAAADRAAYALVIESVREGYLLHYGEPRVVVGADPDLRLLAGDYLYALGLERLAGLGDLEAVRELGDLISLCAQVHAEGPAEAATAGALWLAAVAAVTAGGSPALEAAKAKLREAGPGDVAARALRDAALEAASGAGLGTALAKAANSIDFDLPDPPTRG